MIVKTSEKDHEVIDYVSAKSFLLLKRDVLRSTVGSDGPEPVSEVYSDYREVDGVMIPFVTTSKLPGFGNVIIRVKEIRFGVDALDTEFRSNH
ncbi:MAG: hypothetical protein AABO41_05860 [Acidobacteriota bacterium]